MNKTKLSALLTALIITAAANTGLAAEPAEQQETEKLSLTGEASLYWERVKPDGAADSHNGEHTFKLNFSYPVSEKVELYARYAYRTFRGDNTDPSINELDQYGLKLKTGSGNLTIGSQEATLGTLSGLIDLTEVGRDNMLTGAVWETGEEEESYRLLAGRVDKDLVGATHNSKLFGAEASKAFGSLTVSGEYLHASDIPGISSMYGLGLKTTADKWEFALEGLRSSAKQDASGILAGVTYSPAEAEAISATYRNLKANSVVTGLATYDAGTKGVELAWEKSLSDNWSLKLSHEWIKYIDTNAKEKLAAIETIYTF